MYFSGGCLKRYTKGKPKENAPGREEQTKEGVKRRRRRRRQSSPSSFLPPSCRRLSAARIFLPQLSNPRLQSSASHPCFPFGFLSSGFSQCTVSCSPLPPLSPSLFLSYSLCFSCIPLLAAPPISLHLAQPLVFRLLSSRCFFHPLARLLPLNLPSILPVCSPAVASVYVCSRASAPLSPPPRLLIISLVYFPGIFSSSCRLFPSTFRSLPREEGNLSRRSVNATNMRADDGFFFPSFLIYIIYILLSPPFLPSFYLAFLI